jgi:hypothetical protein
MGKMIYEESYMTETVRFGMRADNTKCWIPKLL